MAIQMRRGLLALYDESKMLAAEWGISTDDDTERQKAFIAFAPGVSKEVMMVEDAEAIIAGATAEAIADATEQAKAWARGDGFHVNDYASGDGSTTSFVLTEAPDTVLGVYVDGVATQAYTLSGKTITFTTAPASGSNNIRVYYTVNTTTDNAKYYKEHAASSASTASSAASTATSKASEASSSASTASTASTTATTQATKAESYAVGGTGSRTGENTDNAKYYKEQAEAAAAMLDAEKILGNFATYQATTTAIKAYNVGAYLTYNGYLYKVKTAILLGGTITPGTNCEQTNVGAELATIFGGIAKYEPDSTHLSKGYNVGDYCIADNKLYRFVKHAYSGDAIVAGTHTSSDNAEETTIAKEMSTDKLWYYHVPVTATTGQIVDIIDSRITPQHVLAEITWTDSSKITSLSLWTTEIDGHFSITGAASAATECTVLLERANVIEDWSE